ncbi:MAG: response regulator, partial [Bacteroidales bacterium]|nr:response regulator [Bacteroidales bacterium]
MAKSKAKILVVDDNNGIRAALGLLLPMHFAQVELIPSPKELVSRLADFRPDVVLLDMNFHTDINTGNEGLFWLSEIKKRCEDVEVVLFTAYADIQLAVEGMKRGAFDFIVKPWDNEKLIEILKAAYSNRSKEAREASAMPASSVRMYWGNGSAM